MPCANMDVKRVESQTEGFDHGLETRASPLPQNCLPPARDTVELYDYLPRLAR